MSGGTPQASDLRERAIAAVQALEAVEADPTVEQYVDALLPVIDQEIAVERQRIVEAISTECSYGHAAKGNGAMFRRGLNHALRIVQDGAA
jgi:hypothetical protein